MKNNYYIPRWVFILALIGVVMLVVWIINQ